MEMVTVILLQNAVIAHRHRFAGEQVPVTPQLAGYLEGLQLAYRARPIDLTEPIVEAEPKVVEPKGKPASKRKSPAKVKP